MATDRFRGEERDPATTIPRCLRGCAENRSESATVVAAPRLIGWMLAAPQSWRQRTISSAVSIRGTGQSSRADATWTNKGSRGLLRPMHAHMIALLVAVALFSACAGTGPGAPPPAFTDLRVVSYNIRHGRGMDDKVDLARTAATLRALAPDLVALQEVDQNVVRSGGIDEAAELGRALGMQHAFGSFMDYQGGRYGMAILSRLPVRQQRVIELPPGNEPRIALLVEIEALDGTRLSLICVHFNWIQDDTLRYAQASKLCTFLDALTTPWLVVGDFNDEPGSRTLALFDARARAATKPAGLRFTFPADEPRKEIDFVYAAPSASWDVGEVRVVDERMASDHRPVLAVLTLRRARNRGE